MDDDGKETPDTQTLFKESFKGKIKEKYHFSQKLASGGFGIVYLAEDRETGKKYAIKAIQKKKVKDFNTFINEVKILQALDHPNIIKLYEIWEWNEVCFLVLEYCEGGELFHYIIEKKYLSEEVAAYIMRQLFAALEYLHEHKISHRDIKPENFMLYKKDDMTCVKMIDFGLSKDFSEANTMSTMSGSPYYIAPEVFLQKYNCKIDMWSMGVVLYIMLSGKVPFPGRDEREIISNVLKGEFHFNHQAFQSVSEECKDLIKRCLVKDFSDRISAKEALAHKWIREKAENGLNSGTVGGGVGSSVIDGINGILGNKFKEASMFYLSQKVTPHNFSGLEQSLKEMDTDHKGTLDAEPFLRCLSKTHMKIGEHEMQQVMASLSAEGQNEVNYIDFLKYSYLCHMFLNHYKLELALKELDKDKKGLVTVAQLDDILQNSEDFNFPPQALDMVFTEMLGQDIQNVDRNCVIKIKAFLESLTSQFKS